MNTRHGNFDSSCDYLLVTELPLRIDITILNKSRLWFLVSLQNVFVAIVVLGVLKLIKSNKYGIISYKAPSFNDMFPPILSLQFFPFNNFELSWFTQLTRCILGFHYCFSLLSLVIQTKNKKTKNYCNCVNAELTEKEKTTLIHLLLRLCILDNIKSVNGDVACS